MEIVSVCGGVVKDITEVNDEVFSNKMLGDGMAIKPERKEKMIYSPVDGKVVSLFPTYHAVGIRAEDGTEILIHVGIDTVNLNGKHMKSYIKEGDSVCQGEPLLQINFPMLRLKGYDDSVIIIATHGLIANKVAGGKINSGEYLFETSVEVSK